MIEQVGQPRRKEAGIKGELEAEYGKPLMDILIEAINEAGSVRGAAKKLGKSPTGIQYWVYKLQIELRTVARRRAFKLVR